MSAISLLNPSADVLRKNMALSANVSAAVGLENVLKPNFGPGGTMKMIVGGAGQIKISKDGSVLLHEMQIQHPTASMIARVATAQDVIVGDGTTSVVLLVGELLQQCERYVHEGTHPRLLSEGVEKARVKAMEILESMKIPLAEGHLLAAARTCLRTKIHEEVAIKLAGIVLEAVEIVRPKDGGQIDLHMVEVMHMKHRLSTDTRLVRGLVMDHGCRHPDMPKKLRNCHVLICNVSLEYEKSEINSTFVFSNAQEREDMVIAERTFTDAKVLKVIELKRKVCAADPKASFVILNQKGIDPPALDMFAKEGIMALRRVKRRNMERLMLACGGEPMNSVDDLTPSDLGWVEQVEEVSLGEEKYTFVEGCKNPQSCTILIKGPNDHSIAQVKDAVRDGLRAVKNCLEDDCVIPGAGAFEFEAYMRLQEYAKEFSGKRRLGIMALAQALVSLPKILVANSGHDAQDAALAVIEVKEKSPDAMVGVDLSNGKVIVPAMSGIFDNYCVKRQSLSLAPTFACQLLLVDEIIKAGKQMGKAA